MWIASIEQQPSSSCDFYHRFRVQYNLICGQSRIVQKCDHQFLSKFFCFFFRTIDKKISVRHNIGTYGVYVLTINIVLRAVAENYTVATGGQITCLKTYKSYNDDGLSTVSPTIITCSWDFRAENMASTKNENIAKDWRQNCVAVAQDYNDGHFTFPL